jgi:hypothetical protein
VQRDGCDPDRLCNAMALKESSIQFRSGWLRGHGSPLTELKFRFDRHGFRILLTTPFKGE